MKIKMMCTMVQSFIVGHGCQPWELCEGKPHPPKEARYQVSFEMADQESGHGSISVRVENEYELAKWVPGMEYEVEIGVQVPPVKTMEPEEVPIEKYFEHLEKMGLIQKVPDLTGGPVKFDLPTDLNVDGIVGMYSDLPQPVGTAEGGVQPVVDEDKPIAYVKRPMLDFYPPRAYPQASTPVPTDLNVDADE